VRRETLLATLLESRAVLVLASAPAGTGKTTLLAQWIAATDRPSAWLQLDAADDDPVVLLTYLAFALSRVATLDPVVFDLLRLPTPPIEERIVPMLALAVSDARPFVLVIDDAHHVAGGRGWRAVTAIVDSLPPGAQVCVGTRVDPPLPLARMLAAGSLLEVRTAQLAFDRDEAAQLLATYTVAPDDRTLEVVMTATEGWATGLYLASIAGRDRPFVDWPSLLHGDRREIAAFLTTEVLDVQPAEVQDFLLQTSILDRVEPSACRALTGRNDAHELLSRVARENLFVSAVDGLVESFRYHPLFAELLRLELHQRDAAAAAKLHRRAAEWFLERGDLDMALRHRLAAGDVAEAGTLVATWWRPLWEQGLTETVRRWLGSFTDVQILADPHLTLAAGWVYSALSDVRLGELWAGRACSARVDDGPSPDGAASLRSSQTLLRATLARDGITGMRRDAELAAKIETTPGSGWYAEAQWALGAARWLSGATRRSIDPLQTAAREGRAFNWSAQLASLGLLSLISTDEGAWDEAEAYAREAEERLAKLASSSTRRVIPMLLARARIQAYREDPEGPLTEARAVEVLERMVPHPWMRLLTVVILGEVRLERGDPHAAERWSHEAQQALARYPDAGVLRARAERLRRAAEENRLREPLTPSEHRVLELLPTHLTESQIAERLFVSKNTVKTHLRGLYRKLDANTRAEAVERGRTLGLIKTD
jgi:LuxR family maltose regulon positive regulatory protein